MTVLETILTGVAASGAYDLTKESALAAYRTIRKLRPDLIGRVEASASRGDDAALREAITGVLEVLAASGEAEISGALLQASNRATFHHQHGRISIGNATITAPVLMTGGSGSASGETIIGGNTRLSSAGTSVHVGQGASIRMTGGASIKQT